MAECGGDDENGVGSQLFLGYVHVSGIVVIGEEEMCNIGQMCIIMCVIE